MHVHELHAAAVHAPLVLLPVAAAADLRAAITGRPAHAKMGRQLWWFGVGSGLLAGIAGMAASQEVKTDDKHTDDMMWLHGIANLGIVLGGLGIAAWRLSHRPTVLQSTIGLAAAGLSLYTAYLGGEMVYGKGVGVRAMPKIAPDGVRQSPPVLSAAAPGAFLRDAVQGAGWLVGRLATFLRGRRRLDKRSLGVEG
jgi:uncharacterized membrane protein